MKKHLVLTLAILVLSIFSWTHMGTAATGQPDSEEAALAESARPAEAAAKEGAEVFESLRPEDGKVFLSWCDQACVDQCLAEEQACKDACNGDFWCEAECGCDKYWCTDACAGCEQDPPPILCQ